MAIKDYERNTSLQIGTVSLNKYEYMIMNKSINSREMIIWFRSKEEFDTSKYFWCNEAMSEKLGLDRTVDGLIRNTDYYDVLVQDYEGKELLNGLRQASVNLRSKDSDGYESYTVKARNKKTGKLVYLHYILEVFERYPDGSLKTWGGNGIDVTDYYLGARKDFLIEGIGSINYDMMTNKIIHGEKEVELNLIESRLLLLLIDANGELVTYQKMKEFLDYQAVTSVMDFAKVYVHRIRKKLKQIGCEDVKIVSHYSKGYSLRVLEIKDDQ